MKLDENAELEIEDFEAYFALAAKMNPECEYWL